MDGEDEKSARVCAGKTEKSGAWAATELVWAAGDIFGVDPKLGRQPQFLGLLRLPASQMFVQPPSPLPPLPSSPVLEPPATTAVQAPAWAVQSAGSGSTIATDGAGGAFVTGWFSDRGLFGSTSLLSSRSMSTFVMHVTASGTIDWGVKAGGESECAGYSIASDGAGGAFVAGYFGGKASFGSTLLEASDEYDVFVMHVTASGAIDWAVQAGGMGSDHGYEIAQDGMGGALVTGDFSGKASFGSTTLVSRGSYDAFVMHVTASGAIDWVVRASSTSSEPGFRYGLGIAHYNGSGRVLVSGTFMGDASFGSKALSLHADKPSCFAASLVPGKDTGLIPFPDVEIVPSPPPWSQAAPSSAPTREGIPIGDSYAALGASLAFAASILTVSALLLW